MKSYRAVDWSQAAGFEYHPACAKLCDLGSQHTSLCLSFLICKAQVMTMLSFRPECIKAGPYLQEAMYVDSFTLTLDLSRMCYLWNHFQVWYLTLCKNSRAGVQVNLFIQGCSKHLLTAYYVLDKILDTKGTCWWTLEQTFCCPGAASSRGPLTAGKLHVLQWGRCKLLLGNKTKN